MTAARGRNRGSPRAGGKRSEQPPDGPVNRRNRDGLSARGKFAEPAKEGRQQLAVAVEPDPEYLSLGRHEIRRQPGELETDIGIVLGARLLESHRCDKLRARYPLRHELRQTHQPLHFATQRLAQGAPDIVDGRVQVDPGQLRSGQAWRHFEPESTGDGRRARQRKLLAAGPDRG